jgi:DNA ligase D-like protein (predicted 3'-phosphoesterase)
MVLEKYKKKRNFRKTPEPKPRVKKRSKENPIYVIQKHWATRLHHDLRLEFEGVLKSWAIPKDPLEANKRKLLAVQVEDHPLDYAKFEGVIPEGNYGAGKVKIWDRGTFELINKKENKIIFKINGKKLKGNFVLVKFKPPKNWLFFKKKE